MKYQQQKVQLRPLQQQKVQLRPLQQQKVQLRPLQQQKVQYSAFSTTESSTTASSTTESSTTASSTTESSTTASSSTESSTSSLECVPPLNCSQLISDVKGSAQVSSLTPFANCKTYCEPFSSNYFGIFYNPFDSRFRCFCFNNVVEFSPGSCQLGCPGGPVGATCGEAQLVDGRLVLSTYTVAGC